MPTNEHQMPPEVSSLYHTHLSRSPVNFLFDALPPQNNPKKKQVFISYRGLSWLPSALTFRLWGQKLDSALTYIILLKGEKSHVPLKLLGAKRMK